MLLKKSISYFMYIMFKRIFLNFGVISFMNKEMVSLFQLHAYKFGLVYLVQQNLVCIFLSKTLTSHLTRKCTRSLNAESLID